MRIESGQNHMWYESYVSPSARLILRIFPFFSGKSVENEEFLLQMKIIFQVEMDLSFTWHLLDRIGTDAMNEPAY